ncbi:unnamed protein product [Owenia fusiformis]|uniref:Hemoglobinase n=1 Tax=Owenia fusiformis TaxID=6347 RepID=A0A8J1XZ71_OWEFU|nr:unnamed protein product [Owenia fusiformis]
MSKYLVVFLCTLASGLAFPQDLMLEPVAEPGDGKHWALIVAGSRGWFNYRHQADACHAYQIMKKHGIPDERIVVMMYDDIANNRENPTPGIVINRPGGDDVYKGVPKDYTGMDVTPENFLNVLQGNEEAMKNKGSGKVIKSGKNDRVFVNFVDHGATGLVAFPSGLLHAKDLNQAIKSMYEAKKYAQMVFYIEACESGSMFENLLAKDINVFATTASNAKESSYACYFDKKRRTYLGDVYSVKWMEDSDMENLNTETLQKQFKIVKKETNTSHVMEYGDMAISSEPVADFQSGEDFVPFHKEKLPPVELNAVPSEEVPLAILYHSLEDATSESHKESILQQIRDIQDLHESVKTTVKHITALTTNDHVKTEKLISVRHTLLSHDCYMPAVDAFNDKCFNLSENDYALRHLYVLVNLCEERYSSSTIIEAIQKTCA